MGTFSNIILTVNEACGENLLNPTDDDIINGIGKDKCAVILEEFRRKLANMLDDFEERDGDICFTINEIEDGCVEEDIIDYILNKHGEDAYLEKIESIDYDDVIIKGHYISNAFSNGAEITLLVFDNENAVLEACRKLAEIYGDEKIGEMLNAACSEWHRVRPKF